MAQFTAEEQTVRIIYTELKKVAMQMTEDSKNVKEEQQRILDEKIRKIKLLHSLQVKNFQDKIALINAENNNLELKAAGLTEELRLLNIDYPKLQQ